MRLGPSGLRRAIPALTLLTLLALVLVYVPGFAASQPQRKPVGDGAGVSGLVSRPGGGSTT